MKNKTIFDFFGSTIELNADRNSIIDFNETLSTAAIDDFNVKISADRFLDLVQPLLDYKKNHRPDDWLYYQLIRKAAESISPKKENYNRYTLYKWYFLTRSGYDAMLTITGNTILFYVVSKDNIYNIPYRVKDGKKYICLNYHDYAPIDFDKNTFNEVGITIPGATASFSYKITRLPEFSQADYKQKDLEFTYNEIPYKFRIKLNPEVKNIFTNYPASDFEAHFNMPLSHDTYGSLIPSLKKVLKGMNKKNGVDFLMHFTRYAFLFKPDTEVFGAEKRMSPEQTLLYDYSDCEDRSALFFFLVKEIYNLPMIVLTYPEHVTIAVQFEKPYGTTINYKGNKYSICEPSPQETDLAIGQLSPELLHSHYEVSYVYQPQKN